MRNKRKTLRLALMASAAATMTGLTPALAQDNSTELGTIQVNADQESATGPVKGYVAGKSSTGSKTGTPVKEIPQTVNVIGREELDDRGVTDKVDEALRYTPGVMAQPFGRDGDTDWIYIRGFDATQTGVFLDGLNLWSYGFGGFQVDPFFLDRVDVLKGPASVLYGGANPGGIVNEISKRPLDEDRIYTEAGINNYGTAFFNFDVNKVLADDSVSARLIGKIEGGDTDNGDEFRGVVAPQVTWSPDEATKLTLYGYYSYLDQQVGSNGFLPYVGTVVPASFGYIDPNADFGEPDSDFSYIRQTMVGYEFEHEFDDGWKVSQNFRYGHVNRHENSPYPYGYYDPDIDVGYLEEPGTTPLLQRIGFEGLTTVDSFSLDNQLTGKFDTGALVHDVLFGIDYRNYTLDTLQKWPAWPDSATPISPTDPVYGAPQPTNAVQLDQTLKLQQIGLYAQDQIHFGGGWLATLNGRYDFVKTELDDRVGATGYDSTDGALSGRAGLAYEFANGFTPYVSAGTFFNPVIGITSGSSALKPEEGYQVEGGFKYEPVALPALFTASVFHIDKQNWSVTGPNSVGQSVTSQIGEVTSTGFEVEAKAEIAEDWKATASFSYTKLEIKEHQDTSLIGNQPYLVPDIQASLWLDYTVPTGAFEGLSIGGGVRYQGESWADMANTKKVPDVVLADAAIRYKKDDWSASLNVNNLFDKEYVAGCQGTLVCGYGEGRTITFKLTKTW
ncbi:TonB-dependent siderophore receptor [Rhizobium halophytocola]|uniref:Iron complex outermembrane receptor protein n=1 Tax=Rhizobium halophytocola TaxID=735519 RepID=A0ABS4E524_9HYPH|nr:TonB-dependent siderophore receptor [Rhizobium halophytocola]MBP1853027.1 iron complex outermembrane receptor protein [Rhizobium halophytocola]